MEYYKGYQIIISEALTEYESVRARTHKSKRIDKKWLKRYGFINTPLAGNIMKFDNKLFMNQVTWDKLKSAIDKEE